MSQFNEDNTVEQLFIDSLRKNGWKYIPADELPRDTTDVIVEPMVKDALIRLNPEIAEDPSRADEVIYKLRAMLQPFPSDNLVAQNEAFKKKLFAGNFCFAPKENVTFIPDKEISPVFANGRSTCRDTIIDNC